MRLEKHCRIVRKLEKRAGGSFPSTVVMHLQAGYLTTKGNRTATADLAACVRKRHSLTSRLKQM